MSLFRYIEKRIDQRLRRVFQSETAAGQGRELVEIQHMILDRIGERVQHLPRARRAFPFNEVAVRIPVPDAEKHAAWEMVFVADDALQEEITEYLRREGVEYPDDLRVSVSLIETAEITDPSVVCRKREVEPRTPSEGAAVPIARFTLPSGQNIELSKARIHLGRIADVLDDRRRIVRRNDIVVDGDT